MEDALAWLREYAKVHRRQFIAPFLIAIFGILGFFALASDIGFSAEVTKHRNKVLLYSLIAAGIISLINVNRILSRENHSLRRDLGGLGASLDTTQREKEGYYNDALRCEEEKSWLRQTILNLYSQVTGGRICEVGRVQYYKERLHLSLKREAEGEVERGDEIGVIDTTDGDLMGVFEVTNVRENDYDAKSTHYVNPLWIGHVLQSGTEIMPPDTVAIIFPKEGNTDE